MGARIKGKFQLELLMTNIVLNYRTNCFVCDECSEIIEDEKESLDSNKDHSKANKCRMFS
jgi:hypothetical protein